MTNQSPYQTGKIAKAKVCDELIKRGYLIKKQDKELSVESPNGNAFIVKVTSLSKPNFWLINYNKNNYYFVLVFMPRDRDPDFYILNNAEMLKEKEIYFKTRNKPITDYKNSELEKLGLSFKQPFAYKNNWSSLPK